jgi:cystathionine gamma-lyase
MKTLAVRVERQNENALRIAEFLEGHSKVRRVYYPFAKSHPQRALAMDFMVGGGGVLSFEVDGSGDDARKIAEFLEGVSKVRRVYYPFAKSHPQRALAMELMRGGGGVLSFEVDGSGDDARKFAESLHLFTLAASLGGVDSLVTLPVVTSHAMISAEQRQKMGVTDQLVRLSVGIEHVDDLIADIDQALSTVSSARQHVEVG